MTELLHEPMDIPGYVVQEQLVRTTRTRLCRAWARESGQSVLLRMPAHVSPRGRDVQDLEYEAALYGELRGTPGIPTLIEFVRDGDVPALVFADAAQRPITHARPHDIGQVLTLGVALARTLDALHARDVILGALGPERVLADDAVAEITLVDLSGAWRTVGQPRPLQTTEAVPFMSPEQTGRLNRVVDARSDLYVLGLLLYDLLVGQLPFESRDPLEVIHFHIAKTPLSPSEVRPDVPDALSHVIMRLLAKDPDDRYQSAAGVEHDLRWCADAWARGGSVAAFPLGRADFSRRLLIAQRLYGRECEVDVLTRAFDEASEGRTALLLVSGYSGVGKTSLINELYRPIVRQRGYFASGKIDQVVRDIPYGVVSQAFGALIRQLLTEPEARLSHWRDRITTALGVNGGVLAEVLRDIELVIGPQPAPPPVDAAEAQNRFQYAVQRFVAALADAEHPLVVFLDDLQWVDAATLGVVYTLLTTPDIHHLLIIGAYRDNEVGDDHLLLRTLRALEKTGTPVHRVTLAPLTLRDVRAFVGDTLRGDWPELDPLARLLLAKTDGNPFFMIQFMKMLVQDGLIAPDPDHARWTIRIDAIERAQITDNVIDLMTSKIRRLPARAQRTLTAAACIGNRFEWSTLLLVGRQAPDAIALGLSECVEAGLILRKGESYDTSQGTQPRVTYAFLHDGVQQAAYDLLPEAERVAAHLDVGRLMLADCGTAVPDERLFEIVNHLNMGSPLIADAGERVQLAQLNLAAGQKAKASTAFSSAAAYLAQGIALAGSDSWNGAYGLLFSLHIEAAECEYLCGRFDAAERHFRLLLDRAQTPLERAQVHALRITLYEHQSRWGDALFSGREGLALFGIAFPDTPEAKQAALDEEVVRIGELLGTRPIASLVDLPRVEEPERLMVLRILTILWAPAYISGDDVLPRLISATMVRLSLAYGNSEDSAYGYVTHAITVGPIRGDYAAAFEWGLVALAVNERFDDRRRRAKIQQQFQAHVNLWCRPLATCIPYAREATRSGLEAGDFVYAGYGAATEAWAAWLTCANLDHFVRDYTPTLALLQRLGMREFEGAHHVVLNWARALLGRTAGPHVLSTPDFDVQAYAARVGQQSPFFLTFVYAAQLHLALLFGRVEEAIDVWRRARAVAVTGTIWPVMVDAWGALALASAGTASREVLDDIENRLAALAEHSPENFHALALLVRAQRAFTAGDHEAAQALSQKCAAYAQRTSQLPYEALAHELHGRTCRALRDEVGVRAALLMALRCYQRWGATTKVRQLAPQVEGSAEVGYMHADVRPVRSDEEPGREPSSLDMVTVLKLARALAGELNLDDLLRRLMSIAMENAGAKRCVFVLERGGALTVEAEGQADPEQVLVGSAVELEQSDRVPHTIVQYVRRTGHDVVLGHASLDERFTDDPYVRLAQPRSILCVPVSHQGRLGGILYLENDLTADAFTPQRAELIRIVAAQAAISLENARLYGEMQREVQRRADAEQALRDALTQLQALKNRLEAENVYLQEEIQTQHNFTDIVGNSASLREALRRVERVAPTGSTVLITGETGTGKEILARAVHSRSTRRDRPLVKVNCGAIPTGLVESELFGHEKGAFTGALQRRTGRFELANGGSIFLDEVGELPLDTQVKLLRVLQEQEFEPVGGSRPIRVDVRVMAATNRDLEAMVREGTFRADLYYRLNVFPIRVPPLRERVDDIPLLVAYFLTGLAKKLGKPLEGVSGRSLERLQRYDWPGNVRELQNVIERAAILAPGAVVDLQSDLLPATSTQLPSPSRSAMLTLEDLERQHILQVVRQTNWTIEGQKGAATILGLHPNTLRSRMKKLGIVRGVHDIS